MREWVKKIYNAAIRRKTKLKSVAEEAFDQSKILPMVFKTEASAATRNLQEDNTMAIPGYLWITDEQGNNIKGPVNVNGRIGSFEIFLNSDLNWLHLLIL